MADAQWFCRNSWGSPRWPGEGHGGASGFIAAPRGQLSPRLCRYYYNKRILHKTKGKRFTYKFNFSRLIVINYPLWEVRAPPSPHLLLGAPALFRPALLPMGMPSEVGAAPGSPRPAPRRPPALPSASGRQLSGILPPCLLVPQCPGAGVAPRITPAWLTVQHAPGGEGGSFLVGVSPSAAGCHRRPLCVWGAVAIEQPF